MQSQFCKAQKAAAQAVQRTLLERLWSLIEFQLFIGNQSISFPMNNWKRNTCCRSEIICCRCRKSLNTTTSISIGNILKDEKIHSYELWSILGKRKSSHWQKWHQPQKDWTLERLVVKTKSDLKSWRYWSEEYKDVSSGVKSWNNIKRLANRCDHSCILERQL